MSKVSARRNAPNRLSLIRTCHTCGKTFSTTADNPFMRQLPADGKKQKTCYFCSEACWRASYKYSGCWDGLTSERRKERDKARQKEKNRKYYEAHKEQIRAYQNKRYWENREEAAKNSEYNRKKRKLLSCVKLCGKGGKL